jgi:murein DD-endopeptidase MepM/ murein hydrolase activator NlpD
MSREAETTQRPSANGGTFLSIFYRYPQLLRGLCWLSSLGVLSSGFVWAQNEPTAKTVVVPASKETPKSIQTETEPTLGALSKPSPPEVSARVFPERSPTIELKHSVAQPQKDTAVETRPSLVQMKPAVLEFKHRVPQPERAAISEPPLLQTRQGVIESKRPSQPATPQAEAPTVGESKHATPERETASKQPLTPPDVVIPTIPETVAPNREITFEVRPDQDSAADVSEATEKEKPQTSAIRIKPSVDCNRVLQNDQALSGQVCGTSRVSRQTGNRGEQVLPAPHLGKIKNPQIAKVKTPSTSTISVKPINLEEIRLHPSKIRIINRSDRPQAERTFTTSRNRINYSPLNQSPITQSAPALNFPRSLADFTALIPSFVLPGNGTFNFMFPLTVPAPITSGFGWRIHPITGDRRLHAGTDLGAPMGTPVVAAAAGQVVSADWMGGYGNAIVIQHGQIEETLYGHLSAILVQPGQWVEQGTIIGQVGSTGNSTGPHLHFETRQLTSEGWIAVDSGVQLEYALNQLVNGLQTAQAVTQAGG